MSTVRAVRWRRRPASVHTGDDRMAVAYGDTIKTNVDTMGTGLDVLKGLRVTCPEPSGGLILVTTRIPSCII